MQSEIEELVKIVEDISKGKYSNDIYHIVKEDTPEYIRQLIESIGLMMVKIEARELKLEYLIEELKQMNEKIRQNSIKTVASISKALAARDNYTVGHAERVADYSARLAKRIGLNDDDIESIRIAGILHDIGKINFSDKIFSNVDVNLTPDMHNEIKRHPEIAYQILKDLDFIGSSLNYVYSHHERLDGKGYPQGLSESEIPLGAKIISVCDCFDAITTNRSYQKAKTFEEAIAILRKISNTQLDAGLVENFIQEISEKGML